MLIIVDLTAARVETSFQQCSQTIPTLLETSPGSIYFFVFSLGLDTVLQVSKV